MDSTGDWLTVKQLADLAGVSTRTLHYYDEIGMLRPTRIAANGYRQYDHPALLRLQQIRFYRELGIGLDQTRSILDRPGYDPLQALYRHRQALQSEADRLHTLLATLDKTILHIEGKARMSDDELFTGFTPEQEQAYEAEARRHWGDEKVSESARRWKATSQADRQRILNEGGAIYRELDAHRARDPESPEVQALIGRWHEHLRNFYEPTPEILRGLGAAYAADPAFADFFARFDAALPGFMHQAIEIYCDRLEGAG
jgi:DNA-binding transcriptional MerR regulator